MFGELAHMPLRARRPIAHEPSETSRQVANPCDKIQNPSRSPSLTKSLFPGGLFVVGDVANKIADIPL